MAELGAVGIFGVITGVMGLLALPVSLTSSSMSLQRINMPNSRAPPPGKPNTWVRIGLGLSNRLIDGHELIDPNGTSPMIVAFNEKEKNVGMSAWYQRDEINDGGFRDIEVVHFEDTQFTQATHLQIVASEPDPICIAYITETWTDETKRGWIGNMGFACGYEWGYSNIIVGEGSSDFKPLCTWIARHSNKDIYSSALQINMESFRTIKEKPAINDTAKYCKPPIMLFKDEIDYRLGDDGDDPSGGDFNFYTSSKNRGGYPNMLGREGLLWRSQQYPHKDPPPPSPDATTIPWPAPSNDVAATPRKDNGKDQNHSPAAITSEHHRQKREEALTTRMAPHNRIITSADPQHSARRACSHTTYRGPDIISLHERLFCDHDTNTLWPVCDQDDRHRQDQLMSSEHHGHCFDASTLSFVRPGGVALPKRDYLRHEVWELNGDIVVDGVVRNTQQH